MTPRQLRSFLSRVRRFQKQSQRLLRAADRGIARRAKVLEVARG